MSKCAVKRGIIALRDCGNEASGTCAECSRPICQEHTRIGAAQVLCVECYARREQQATANASKAAAGGAKPAAPARKLQDDYEDPAWPYYYRHHYYTTSYYHPFYSGSYYDRYYDDYDLRSFRGSHHTELSDEDDSTAGGFYDS